MNYIHNKHYTFTELSSEYTTLGGLQKNDKLSLEGEQLAIIQGKNRSWYVRLFRLVSENFPRLSPLFNRWTKDNQPEDVTKKISEINSFAISQLKEFGNEGNDLIEFGAKISSAKRGLNQIEESSEETSRNRLEPLKKDLQALMDQIVIINAQIIEKERDLDEKVADPSLLFGTRHEQFRPTSVESQNTRTCNTRASNTRTSTTAKRHS